MVCRNWVPTRWKPCARTSPATRELIKQPMRYGRTDTFIHAPTQARFNDQFAIRFFTRQPMTDLHTMPTVPYPLSSSKRSILAALLVSASLGLGLHSGAWAQTAPAKATKPTPQLIDSIVAVVNDDVITRRELSERIDTVAKRMKA